MQFVKLISRYSVLTIFLQKKTTIVSNQEIQTTIKRVKNIFTFLINHFQKNFLTNF